MLFCLMKLWLYYLTRPYRKRHLSEDLADTVDTVSSMPDFSSSSSASDVTGHGGGYGGAGASGGWTEIGDAAEGAESIGDTATEAVGEAVSGIADESGVILIPLILFLIVLLGGGFYLIYDAPVII